MSKKALLLSLAFLALLVIGYLLVRSPEGTGEDGAFRIARAETWPSVPIRGREKSLTAFSDELTREIARERGIEIEIVRLADSLLFPALREGRVDAILSATELSPRDHTLFASSDYSYIYGPVLIVQKDSPITSLRELKGSSLGIPATRSLVDEIEIDPTIFVIPYRNIREGLYDLNRGDLDALLFYSTAAHEQVNTFFPDLRIVTTPLVTRGVYLIARKDRAGDWLVEQFNEGLDALKKSGQYHKLLQKWGLTDPNISR